MNACTLYNCAYTMHYHRVVVSRNKEQFRLKAKVGPYFGNTLNLPQSVYFPIYIDCKGSSFQEMDEIVTIDGDMTVWS